MFVFLNSENILNVFAVHKVVSLLYINPLETVNVNNTQTLEGRTGAEYFL